VSFRRDKTTARKWQAWVQAHEDELVACGVPREVFADELTWWLFVDHGYHPPVSNARDVRFNVSDLTAEQQERLYQFLDAVLSENAKGHSSSLWSYLHFRFGKRDVPSDELP
jgi:hypothetical protein